ncbi:MAG: aromatic ring-hydroxylating dioxygenase subunit alpha [Pseudomonadota bacterium]
MADGIGKTTLISYERCPGTSYTDLLDQDTREVPDFLREESNEVMGCEPLDVRRYTSKEFMDLENEKMWPKVWQFAAREEDMPDPGDTVLYENGNKSFLVIRQEDGSVRAFYNVCLHRGRKLRTKSGYSRDLTCMFHGFKWHNDGSIKEIPCRWDFGHLKDEKMKLPELRVSRWQGFIMICEDPDVEDFEDWVGPSIKHYERWRLDECHTIAWVGRVIPANWKATAEAFMEAWHSITTHPQILPFTGDANTRYDVYGDHMNRAITPSAVLSPHIADKYDQQYILEKLAVFAGNKEASEGKADDSAEDSGDDTSSANPRRPAAPDRFSMFGDEHVISPDDPVFARKIIADANRKAFSAMSGRDYSDLSDSEMTDNFTYNIFPNFAPWGGFIPNIVYRWLPWKDPDHCMMEIRVLTRGKVGEKPPKTPPMHLIPEDEPFVSAAHLLGTGLATVFDQDMANLPYVQEGMKASGNGLLELGNYQESRIRHFHQTLDKYLNA